MQLPKTIDNKSGEVLIFKALKRDAQGEYLEVENFVSPGAGPPMHTHHRQEEALTVVTGKIAYQVNGEAVKYAGPGEQLVFKAGVSHKFWNAGQDTLHCVGYIRPPDNIVYFLGEIFESQARAQRPRPSMIDAAFLTTKYKSEFRMDEIPAPVQMLLFPILIVIGKLTGQLKRYDNAPPPVI